MPAAIAAGSRSSSSTRLTVHGDPPGGRTIDRDVSFVGKNDRRAETPDCWLPAFSHAGIVVGKDFLEASVTVRILLDGPRRPVGPRIARVLAAVISPPLIMAGVVGWAGFAAVAYLLATSSAPATDLHNSLP